ncbi:hypothetical protein ANCDUO_10043, partial [Ancylostoma duodenale]
QKVARSATRPPPLQAGGGRLLTKQSPGPSKLEEATGLVIPKEDHSEESHIRDCKLASANPLALNDRVFEDLYNYSMENDRRQSDMM